jgi:hypothetical protein
MTQETCSVAIAAGMSITAPDGIVTLAAPPALTTPLIANFVRPAGPTAPVEFAIMEAMTGGAALPLTALTPPLSVSVAPGAMLFAWNPALGAFRAVTGNVITQVGIFKVDRATPFHFAGRFAADDLALGNAPLTVTGGQSIRLFASTFPGARVTISVFHSVKSGIADAAGDVEFIFRAPQVTMPRVVFYRVHAIHAEGNGALSSFDAEERFRVLP